MSRGDAALQQRGERGGVETVDQREVGVDRGRGERLPERFGRLEGAQNPGNSHQRSLIAGHRHGPSVG